MATEKTALPSHTQKTLELFRLLAGYDQIGLAPGEIARALQIGAPWVSVNLPLLAEAGYCERVKDTPRWRLGLVFLRIANTVFTANTSAEADLQQRRQNIRTPL